MTRNFDASVTVFPPDRIEITIKGFESGAVRGAICKLVPMPGRRDDIAVTIREGWHPFAPAGTRDEEILAHTAINLTIKALLKTGRCTRRYTP